MSLIYALEGLTAVKDERYTLWADSQDTELGVFDRISSYRVWTRPPSVPLVDKASVKEDQVAQQLLEEPSEPATVGGIKILIFHNWKSSRSEKDAAKIARQASAIRAAMNALGLPLWILSRLFTHSFFLDPSNPTIDSAAGVRRYWQRFRGGFLLWSHDATSRITRGLFFCRQDEYWQSLQHCLDRSQAAASQPMLCGVLAYIQQIKASVAYIYKVRDRVDEMVRELDKILLEEMSEQGHRADSRARDEEQDARMEQNIGILARYALDITRAVPFLNDNRGNLYRISDSLTAARAENAEYQRLWSEKCKSDPTFKTLVTQADELTGLIDALLTEIKSQIQAADWVFTKVDTLFQSANLSINRTDQRRNLEIADSSYTIAVESKRDNLSMMTIAAITMIFLPGTFVASFFAMPILDWSPDKSQHVVNSRFW
jgi:hypothetical protein